MIGIADLHRTWGTENYHTHALSQGSDTFTCYESVYNQLAEYTKQRYEQAPEKIIEEVYNIYRSINIVPISYYTEQGLREVIHTMTVASYNEVEGINGQATIGLGNNQGQSINRFCFPNMMTAEPKGRGSNSLKDRFYDDVKLRRAIRICFEFRTGDNLASPTALRRALELVTGENIQNFKPQNARAIVEYLCPVLWGNVYDYSAGYGGRLLGITGSTMSYNYTAVDPNTETVEYLNYLNECIHAATGRRGTIIKDVSELYQPSDIDLAFSSPPYFNLEKYSDEPTQCMNQFTTLDEWFEGYVAPTMQNIHRGLNPDGVFATNIADYKVGGKTEFKVCERWIELAEKLGFKYKQTIRMMLNTRPGVGNNKVAGREKWEGVYVFTK
jgi:SAM-dependent methyltransferase